MTPQLRHEILGLERPLLAYAAQVCNDEEEARNLVEQTLRTALNGESQPRAGGDTRLWLFGLMRSAFHSVARRQAISRERRGAGQQWRADRAAAFSLTSKGNAA